MTQEVFNLDKSARDANITVIVGFGLSPGVNNILARLGADKLDEVEEINVAFCSVPMTEYSYAVYHHLLHIFSGEILAYRNGKWVKLPALTEKETIECPGMNPERIDVYLCGHPEPVSIPRFLKGVKKVTIKGGYLPWFMERIRNISDYGLTSTEPIKVGDTIISPRDFILGFLASPAAQKILAQKLKEEGIEPGHGDLMVQIKVKGKEAGKSVCYTYRLYDRERRSVYLAAAIGTQMLALGEIEKKGVIAPEAIDNPKRIIDRLAHNGIACYELREEITEIIPK